MRLNTIYNEDCLDALRWRDAEKEPPEEELVVLSDKHELVFKWKGEWFRAHVGVKGSETTVRTWIPLPEYYAEEEQGEVSEKETHVRIGHGDTEERFVVRESVGHIKKRIGNIFSGNENFIVLTKIKACNERMPAEEMYICVNPSLLPRFEFWEQEPRKSLGRILLEAQINKEQTGGTERKQRRKQNDNI